MTEKASVDKLPRLMQAGPPQLIDPARFADKNERIVGDLKVVDLRGLADLVEAKDEKITFELNFDRDQNRRITIAGGFSSELTMRCQRCLLPLKVKVEHVINIALIADEDEAKTLPRCQEGFVITDKTLSLNSLIEEELLLALPLAPLHETSSCSEIGAGIAEVVEERQYPFEMLKDFKTNK